METEVCDSGCVVAAIAGW